MDLSFITASNILAALVVAGTIASILAPHLSKWPRVAAALGMVASIGLDARKLSAKAQEVASGEPKAPEPKLLYNAYLRSSDGLNYEGKPCPVWEELPPPTQSHWRAAARKAAEKMPS
jgi:hypothetical protein